jgi:hypothetical protein
MLSLVKPFTMRKKIYFTIAIFFSVLQLSAQFQKKQIYFDLTGEKRIVRYSTNGLRPSVSVGLGDHSSIGVYVDYTKYKEWNYPNLKGYTENYGVGVFYDYYRFFKGSNKWGWFADADLSFSQFRTFDKTSGASVINGKYNQVTLSLAPGIFFKLSPSVILHADIGGLNIFHNYRYDFLNFSSNFATQVNLGIRISPGNRDKKKSNKSLY